VNAAKVTNITDTLIDPVDGLKIFNDVNQLAVFEFAGTHTSAGTPQCVVQAASRQ